MKKGGTSGPGIKDGWMKNQTTEKHHHDIAPGQRPSWEKKGKSRRKKNLNMGAWRLRE